MKAAKTAKAVKVAAMPLRKRRGETVTISKQEYEGLKETIDLLSSAPNARRLRSALAQAKAGKLKEREL